MIKIPHEMLEALARAEQEMVPPDLRAKGWIYRDMPGKVTPELWDQFLKIMGDGEYQIVIASAGPNWRRGQFFISPLAIERLKAHVAERRGDHQQTRSNSK